MKMSLKFKVTTVVIFSILHQTYSMPTRVLKNSFKKIESSDGKTLNDIITPYKLMKRSEYASVGYNNFNNYPMIPVEHGSNLDYYPNNVYAPHHTYNGHHFHHFHHFPQFSSSNYHNGHCVDETNHYGSYNLLPYGSSSFGEYPQAHNFENRYGGFNNIYDPNDPHHILHNNNILDLTDGFNEHGDKIGTVFPLLPDLVNHAPFSTIDNSCYHCWNDCSGNEYLHHGSSLGYPFMLPPLPFVVNAPLVNDESEAENKGKKEEKEVKKNTNEGKDKNNEKENKEKNNEKEENKEKNNEKEENKEKNNEKEENKEKNNEKEENKEKNNQKEENKEKNNEKEENKVKNNEKEEINVKNNEKKREKRKK
ncbi:GATA zinc finger domain-containing protein 14-like isoform X2 [Hydra vulgaris]|uniref:GATA zinc finger domain-containing protein 14-like isoform X2 n=1 Tax=Hydra vulgaris TaxID=6087 RepID=A0ABM4CFJ6_HYDVU